MPYEYLEETAIADIAFKATGPTLEKLFQAAADAVINVMIEDLDTLDFIETRTFEEKNQQLDLLLFDFLQELIFYKDSALILFRAEEVRIEKKNQFYHLYAVFKGEQLNPDKHGQRVDVKAVTLHQFRLEERSNGWEAHVILDI